MLSETSTALCFVLILLVPLAGAGLALINTGLGRSRSAAHSMMTSLIVIAIAAVVYFGCGFSWQGFVGRPAHFVAIGHAGWNWIAAEPFFMRGLALDGSPASLTVVLQLFSVGLAALIPVGAGADRWRLGAICASTALLAGLTYPLFAHWVWGGGWLAQLGTNYGLGRGFVDAGGSSTIQVVGGLTALSIAWILSPRRGKYSAQGMPAAIPAHNIVFVIFGCVLGLVGWLGLNSAGALLFAGVGVERVVLIAVNTILAAASGGLTAAMVTRLRFGKPDASLTANGWMGGLVASSAGCAFVKPAVAVIVGSVAGGLVIFAIEWLEFKLKVDDPAGAISVHLVGGIWGVLAVGIFAQTPGENAGQLLAQIVGAATLVGLILPMTYGLNWLLDCFYPQRVAVDGERQGMDLHELGAEAYPEFVTHSEEFIPR
ncbi:MAG: ammonium transporter [Acidobacteria bacterium]|nr:MAG: ammonium transporter [Acidobacteriota bacterium]